MSKYEVLKIHLENLKNDDWKAKFSEIERILGFSLPKSARHYQAWWANNSQESRHAKAWLDAGWRTCEVNFGTETVMLKRHGNPTLVQTKRVALPSTQKPVACAWDEPCKMKCQIFMEWQPLGAVTLDDRGRLSFPKGQRLPAIYRFRIRYAKAEAAYIGETDNLVRRFGNYRNPGPTQQTSLRINSVLKEALSKGAEIAVSAVTTQAWIDRGTGLEAVSFDSKAMRCLFESAAILDNDGTDIDMLNRANSRKSLKPVE